MLRHVARDIAARRRLDIHGIGIARPSHIMFAKTIAGITNASLVMDADLPADLEVGHFRSEAVLSALVRFSNASGIAQPDTAPDLRGMSIRLTLPDGGVHDLILTNFPTCPARDAGQLLELALTEPLEPDGLLGAFAEAWGVEEGRRFAEHRRSSLRLCRSLALERFSSGCAHLWGDAPVRFALAPAAAPARLEASESSDDMLRLELASRLRSDGVHYRLTIERYTDEFTTPIEDPTIDWPSNIAVEIGTLILAKQDILGPKGAAALRKVSRVRFDQWNAPDAFRPLGSINRLCRLVREEERARDRLAPDSGEL